MNQYSPLLKLYYVQGNTAPDENNRLVPAPRISISPEYYYANDTIIGYTYNITLNGYATSIDLRSYSGVSVDFVDTVDAIKTIKNIFNGNDGTLIALDSGNQLYFKASGINIKNFNFVESDNNWVNYSQYSVELEANEIELNNCSGISSTVVCGSIASGIIDSAYLVDMKQYKIRSFNDNWTFNLDENIYNSYEFDNTNTFNNEYFSVTYTINATGKHYFVNNKLIPSWEQAKNFCQNRLYTQVSGLIYQTLTRSNSNDGCDTIGNLSTIYGSGNYHLLDGLAVGNYNIFNEKINCQTSEAEGSFSLTYNAILKRISGNANFTDPNSIHTFTLVKDIQDDGRTKITNLNLDGNIQGLIEGGLIKGSGILSLPKNGQLLLINPLSSDIDKYHNALSTFNKIVVNNTINPTFANLLGITYSGLNITQCGLSGVPHHSTLTSNHNYNAGTITYRAGYDSNLACSVLRNYTNISITYQDSIPTIQEFIIPGRSGGPIIQNLNIDTPKKITINIDGMQPNYLCCPSFDTILSDACSTTPPLSGIPNPSISNMILTENRYNYSNDGSFSITRGYTYYD